MAFLTLDAPREAHESAAGARRWLEKLETLADRHADDPEASRTIARERRRWRRALKVFEEREAESS